MMSSSVPLRTAACAALAAGLAACGSSSSTSQPGVITNPPRGSAAPGGSAAASASPQSSAEPASGTRTVLAPLGLNLRSQPNSSSPSLGDLGQGAVVTVLAHVGQNGSGWFKVMGQTQTGYISDNPAFSSPRTFNTYQSDQRGFSALYPDSWTFAEHPDEVVFLPQTGGASITVVIAASLDAIGPPGRSGYSLSSTETTEVDGVTGLLRTYDRTGSAPPPSPGQPDHLDHLVEFRATIDAKRAIRADLDYTNADTVPIFRDVLNAIVFPAPAPASPGTSATPPAPSPT